MNTVTRVCSRAQSGALRVVGGPRQRRRSSSRVVFEQHNTEQGDRLRCRHQGSAHGADGTRPMALGLGGSSEFPFAGVLSARLTRPSFYYILERKTILHDGPLLD